MSEPSPYAIIAQVFGELREMEAPLGRKLLLLAQAVRRGSPKFADAVETLIARLDKAGLGRGAPQVGEPMPPFMLPDQNGRLIGLADLLALGPVVISFHRGHWCPYCQMTASAISKVQDRIGRMHMVAITPERRSFNVRLIEQTGIGYGVLTDPDCGYALSINMAFWLDDQFADLMRSIGQDLSAFHTKGAWVLPVPATFVVNDKGAIVARHVDPDYRQRMEIEDLVTAFERAL